MNRPDPYCIASAPSTTANLGPGFDIFGLAVTAYNDNVKITKHKRKENNIIIKISGNECIPVDYRNNSAGLVVEAISRDFNVENDVTIEINKGIPPGYGLGSSAASAAAAAAAFNELFNLKLKEDQLVHYASIGEIASAGVKHYDNVAASVLGGFVIVKMIPEITFTKMKPPSDLFMVISIPKIPVPKKKTEVSRSIIPNMVELEKVINNISNACTMVAGAALNDTALFISGIIDNIIEPIRKSKIPAFDKIKRNATEAGAQAVTISGAGPSIIAFTKGNAKIKKIQSTMNDTFRLEGIEAITLICQPSQGVKIIEMIV